MIGPTPELHALISSVLTQKLKGPSQMEHHPYGFDETLDQYRLVMRGERAVGGD